MGRAVDVIAVIVVASPALARADTWVNRGAATDPGLRDGARVAYDSLRDRVILYGGHQQATCGDPAPRQTWAYDHGTNTWTDLAPLVSPGQHGHTGMTYDSASDRVLVFGSTDYPCPVAPADDHLWAYAPATNTWTDMDLTMDPGAPRPTARTWNQLVYADAAGVAILYGGSIGFSTPLTDTWSYDFTTNRWTELLPPTLPNGAALVAAAYDSRRNQVVIYGGSGSGPTVSETWAYDVAANTWTERITTGPAPMPGQDPQMVYDCHSDRFILVDDADATWSFDPLGTAWQQMTPSPALPPVHHVSLAYLPGPDRTVLYPNEFGRQTWAYDDGISPIGCTDPPGPRDGAIDAAVANPDADGNPGTGDSGGCCRSSRSTGGSLVLGTVVAGALLRRRARRPVPTPRR